MIRYQDKLISQAFSYRDPQTKIPVKCDLYVLGPGAVLDELFVTVKNFIRLILFLQDSDTLVLYRFLLTSILQKFGFNNFYLN